MRRCLLLSSRLLFAPSPNVGSSLLPLLSGTCHWLHFSRGYTVQSVHLQRSREHHCQVSVSYNVHPHGIRAPMRVRTRFFQNTGYRERCQPICVRTYRRCVMSCVPPRQSILAFHASTSSKGGGESTNAVHHEQLLTKYRIDLTWLYLGVRRIGWFIYHSPIVGSIKKYYIIFFSYSKSGLWG